MVYEISGKYDKVYEGRTQHKWTLGVYRKTLDK